MRTITSVCPLRCQAVTFMKISVPFRHQLECSLKLQCTNHRQGCLEQIFYGKLEYHERTCQFELANCLNQGCSMRCTKNKMEEHKLQCVYALEICQFCQRDIVKFQMPVHLSAECQLVLVNCDLCNDEVSRRELNLHKSNSCLKVTVKCSHYP